MTAAKRVKEVGLKSLQEVADMTGQSPQTLANWYDNPKKRELFEIVLKGCLFVKFLDGLAT